MDTSKAASMRRDWEECELREFLERQPEAKSEYTTFSGLPLKRVYTPEDTAAIPFEEIGLPGRYPFTRGPYPTMYRGRLWTMRQIAGYRDRLRYERPFPLPDRAGADGLVGRFRHAHAHGLRLR